MNETVTIHSRKLAIYLQCLGFLLLGVEPNLKNTYKVFLFKKSDKIQKAMMDYKKDNEFHSYLTKFTEGR
jgi:hypothetical protein